MEKKKIKIIEKTLKLQMIDGKLVSCTYLSVKQPKYVMIFSHAFGGEASHYRRMFYSILQTTPMAIYCMDLRRGEGDNKHIFDVEDPQILSNDMEHLHAYVKNTHPNVPLYVCAHSGGSGLALKLVTSRAGANIAGLFLLEPVFAGDMEIDYEHSTWLYKFVHYLFQHKKVKALVRPEVQTKWTYKFSVIKYVLSLLHSFFNRFVFLKVRADEESEWNYYTGNYIKGYSLNYADFELKNRLRQIHCPLWITAGENDEYTYLDGLISVVNWHVAPNNIRDIKSFKGISHFGTLNVASSLIARWLKLEETS